MQIPAVFTIAQCFSRKNYEPLKIWREYGYECLITRQRIFLHMHMSSAYTESFSQKLLKFQAAFDLHTSLCLTSYAMTET